MILEYGSNGHLLNYIVKNSEGLGENKGRYFFSQLLDALEYLDNKGVIHRDLKPENILLDEAMNLKITDFGFAIYENTKAL